MYLFVILSTSGVFFDFNSNISAWISVASVGLICLFFVWQVIVLWAFATLFYQSWSWSVSVLMKIIFLVFRFSILSMSYTSGIFYKEHYVFYVFADYLSSFTSVAQRWFRSFSISFLILFVNLFSSEIEWGWLWIAP